MTTLSLTPLVSLDTRFWTARATSLYCRSRLLPRVVRHRAVNLALETHANLASLRSVGPVCPVPPSLANWVVTVMLLLIVSPRLSLAALRLFAACYALRLAPYRAIGDGVALVVGAVVGFGIWEIL